MYLKLALLNLWKYRRRVAVIFAGVVLSVAAMELIGGMLNGMRLTFFSEILGGSGHVQLHARGYEDQLDRYSAANLIEAPDVVVDALREAPHGERVEHAEQLLSFASVLGARGRTAPVVAHGVDPRTRYFPEATENIVAGSFALKERGITISRDDAELLRLEIGDEATILARMPTGVPLVRRLTVGGVFESDHAELGAGVAFMRLSDAQSLLNAADRVSELRVTLRDPYEADDFAASIEPLLDEHGLIARAWREIHGTVIVFVEIADLTAAIINAFVLIVAASVITNAILMTAFDRIATFGALRAIGLKRRQLVGMVVCEGAFVGVAGSLIGLAVAVPVVLYFQTHGLDIGDMGEFFGTSRTYYFSFEAAATARTFIYGVLVASLSALYAGWATARLDLIHSLQEA